MKEKHKRTNTKELYLEKKKQSEKAVIIRYDRGKKNLIMRSLLIECLSLSRREEEPHNGTKELNGDTGQEEAERP